MEYYPFNVILKVLLTIYTIFNYFQDMHTNTKRICFSLVKKMFLLIGLLYQYIMFLENTQFQTLFLDLILQWNNYYKQIPQIYPSVSIVLKAMETGIF